MSELELETISDEDSLYQDRPKSIQELYSEKYEQFINLQDHILNMWELVIIPYLENHPNRAILDKLTSRDYNRFLEFFMNNSQAYQELDQELDQLNHSK